MTRRIAVQAVSHVHVLLKMIVKRKIDKGHARSRQFHAGSQTALHQGDIACGEPKMQVRDIAVKLNAASVWQTRRIDSWARDDHETHFWQRPANRSSRVDDAPKQCTANG